jgi:hypothetical protein
MGGSDEELIRRVKEINKNFAAKLITEISERLEIVSFEHCLPKEEVELLKKLRKVDLSSPKFARELVERKYKILKNNIHITWQNKAIDEVNNY